MFKISEDAFWGGKKAPAARYLGHKQLEQMKTVFATKVKRLRHDTSVKHNLDFAQQKCFPKNQACSAPCILPKAFLFRPKRRLLKFGPVFLIFGPHIWSSILDFGGYCYPSKENKLSDSVIAWGISQHQVENMWA